MDDSRMKKIDAPTFVKMVEEDLVMFQNTINNGKYDNRNPHEWFKLLNDWVEYGFSRRATEEWEDFHEEA